MFYFSFESKNFHPFIPPLVSLFLFSKAVSE